MDAAGLLNYAVVVNRQNGPGGSARARARARQQLAGNLARNPRPLLGGLADDPRLRIWVTRAVLVAAAAIGFTVWQGWRLGLTAAAVVVVADTLLRSRTTSVVPAAARVTAAQRQTRRRLKALRTAGYVALHACTIPDSDSIIDHLVIGPGGVFAVDSEMWDRRLPIRTLSGGRLYHGPFGQKERLEHANWEAGQASARLSKALQRDIKVRPAMVIYGPTVPWHVATLNGVAVMPGGRVRKFFIRQKKISRNARLEVDEIEEIHNAASDALPPMS
jgi:Nuclease-related domain